jgi:hypothetical protein
MAKLYELTENYSHFHDFVENALNSDGEFEEEELQAFIDTLDSIQDTLESKIDNILKFLQSMDGDIKSFKSEESRLAKKRKTLENTYAGLREYTRIMLDMAKIDNMKTPLFSVRLQINNPSVFYANENLIPKAYRIKQPDKFDGTAILADLKLGKTIKGVRIADVKRHLRFS